ncbi:DegV domain-containing protein [Trichinella pseudospiralis]
MGSNVKLLRTCQSHMALKAGCCVLGFPSGPAEHLNRMEDSALVRLMLSTCLWVSSMRSQIYDYSTVRSIIMMYYQRANMVAFYYCGN